MMICFDCKKRKLPADEAREAAAFAAADRRFDGGEFSRSHERDYCVCPLHRYVAKAPGEAPRIVEAGADLTSLQALVGGNIELVRFSLPVGGSPQELDLWVNEKGRIDGLPYNFTDEETGPIYGPVLIASRGGQFGEDTVGLDDAQIAAAMQALTPEIFEVQVRAEYWAGAASDGWRPAIAGSLNQTGRSDEEASRFASHKEALAAARLVRSWLAAGDQVRVVRVAP